MPELRGVRPDAGVPETVTAAGTVLAALLALSVRFVPVVTWTVWVPTVRRLALAVLPAPNVTRIVSLLTVVVASAIGPAPDLAARRYELRQQARKLLRGDSGVPEQLPQ